MHSRDKDKQRVVLYKKLNDFENEFKKRGLGGVPPAIALGNFDRYLQDCHSQIELLKCDLYAATYEWGELWGEDVVESSAFRVELGAGAESSNEVVESGHGTYLCKLGN